MALDWQGAETGIAQWQNDWTAMQNARAQRLQTLGRVAMQPQENRILSAQATGLERELSEKEAFDNLLRRMKAPEANQPMSKTLGDLAVLAGQEGLGNRMLELSKLASTAGGQESMALSRVIGARKNQLSIEMQKAERKGQLLGTATAENFAQRLSQYEQETGDVLTEYRDAEGGLIPFTEDIATDAAATSLSTKNRLGIQLRQTEIDERGEFNDQRLGQYDRALDIRERLAKLQAEREARLKKNDGSRAVRTPTQVTIDQAKRLLRDLNIADEDMLGSLAVTLASEAEELRAQDKSMGMDRSLVLAYKNAEERGDYVRRPTNIPEYVQKILAKEPLSSSVLESTKGDVPERAKPLPALSQRASGIWYKEGNRTGLWNNVPGYGALMDDQKRVMLPSAVGLTEKDLETGRIYETSRGPAVFTGKDWKPVPILTREQADSKDIPSGTIFLNNLGQLMRKP